MSTTLAPDPSWFEIDPAFYAHGGDCFSDEEHFALGELEGQAVLILSANGGEEALSCANLGATVTVLDSAEDTTRARALSEQAHKQPAFVPAMPGGAFDVVYSNFGHLSTLETFDDWAAEIANALRPGGRLVIHDAHPAAHVPSVHKGIFAVAHSYFGEGPGGSPYTLGDLVSALGNAGLATVHLEELPESERYQTPLDRFHNVRWDVRWRLPGAFVLAAFKL